MTRANARELAVHLIYSRCFTEEQPEEIVASRLDKQYYQNLAKENQVYSELPGSTQRAYIDTVVAGVANRESALNDVIQQYSIGWDVSRISRLARCVMQLAIFEVLYMDDIPTGVAISEAVRIIKLYDGNDAGAFVNGILGAFARSTNTEVHE